MNGLDCAEPDVLRDADGAAAAKNRYLSASAGIFALRRAHYFKEGGDFSGTEKPVNRARDMPAQLVPVPVQVVAH